MERADHDPSPRAHADGRREAGGDDRERRGAAKPATGTGKYVAHVVFPSTGTWRFEINNGLSATGFGIDATTTYAPVTVAAPPGSGGFPTLPVAIGILAAATAAAIAAAVVVGPRRRAAQAPLPTT